ncbi:hypothetical protein F4808DRAFT_461319 [Astrocystis sublimbata]|nr:hypothetical protein F4808DRAFT_461319 [Astrocystis sublimbata]
MEDEVIIEDDDGLQEILYSAYVDSKFEGTVTKFCPQDDFDKYLTISAISKEFEELDPRNEGLWKDLILWISTKARKIFAIMMDNNPIKEAIIPLEVLHRIHFTDDCLPIPNPDSSEVTSTEPQFLSSMWNRPQNRSKKGSLGSQMKHGKFYDTQWKFLAPVFSLTQYHFDLHENTIFPFIERYDQSIKEGAFGRVLKFQVHRAHQSHNCTDVAIKEILLNRGTNNENDRNRINAD